jgi:hypothetical protein
MRRAFCKRLYKSRWKIRRVSIELLACSLVNDGSPWLLELPRTRRLAISNWPYQIQFSIPFSPFLISSFFHFSSLNYSNSSRQLLQISCSPPKVWFKVELVGGICLEYVDTKIVILWSTVNGKIQVPVQTILDFNVYMLDFFGINLLQQY